MRDAGLACVRRGAEDRRASATPSRPSSAMANVRTAPDGTTTCRAGHRPPRVPKIERPAADAGNPVLAAEVMEALRTVRDPELPVNLVDLGLIYDLMVRQDGLVYIEMTLTTPACPVAGSLPGQVQKIVVAGAGCQCRAGESGLVAALDARPHERGCEAGTRASDQSTSLARLIGPTVISRRDQWRGAGKLAPRSVVTWPCRGGTNPTCRVPDKPRQCTAHRGKPGIP